MAKRRASTSTDGPNLFDVIEQEEIKNDPSKCTHPRELKTETVWPGETFKRMTWTCQLCGRIRGRC